MDIETETCTRGEHHVKIMRLHKTKKYQTLEARPGTGPFLMLSEGARSCPHLDLVRVASRTTRLQTSSFSDAVSGHLYGSLRKPIW